MTRHVALCLLFGACLVACGSEPDADEPGAGQAGMAGTETGTAGAGTAGTGPAGGGASGTGGSVGSGGDDGSAGAPDDKPTLEERCKKLDDALTVPRPAGWGAATHCKEADPDYELVFGSNIRRLDITVSKETFDAMEKDLEELTNGDPGQPDPGEPEAPSADGCDGLKAGDACIDFFGDKGVCTTRFEQLSCYVAPSPELSEPCKGKSEEDACTVGDDAGRCYSDGVTLVCYPDVGGDPPAAPCVDKQAGASCDLGGIGTKGTCTQSGRLLACQGPLDKVSEPSTPLEAAAAFWQRDPKYFDATVAYEGRTFTHVGYRFKGNNGLASANPNKRPFRLELDELEDANPETTDQRFFGFKELSFVPGANEPAYLSQVLSSEMFARAGVPTPRSALVSVYLDRGDGAKPLGVYAITEVPGDPFTKRVFDDKNGCLYKPDGLGAHLLEHHPESFHVKSKGCPADQADAKALIAALNANADDRDAWRKRLAETLDMDGVVRFFAANQANGNWDTYGRLAHNFYLYGKKSGGPLSFVPWDFDLSLGVASGSDFSLDAFSGEWPLLQAIARDAQLYAQYHEDLAELAAREYDSGLLIQRVTDLSAQVRPLLAAEGASLSDFDRGIAQLKANLDDAKGGLEEYLTAHGY